LGRPGPRQSFHAASIISYPFLELLRGGHLARAQQGGVVSSGMRNAGGLICARRTKQDCSFTPSPRWSLPEWSA